ncbi:UNVERIFIED_CONTAM: hypothetical protein Slati_2697000 [Sesamum latifolium]|uniref:Retrotransposon Copia-like N-terminal domain-containing protein n=1 Tax=Sesamum latifolium TaxID=2727402 RepID=A0AAW2VWB2_9LAMI
MATKGGGRESVAATTPATKQEPDFLQLYGGDHPGMVLVSAPFDGTDFLAWKRSVIIALRTKMKLGFIDGRYVMQDKTSDSYETWIRADSMVTSWILNAMTKRISKEEEWDKSQVLQNADRGNFRGRGTPDKRSQMCSHCGKTGHTRYICFKIHGVPEWYKGLKDQKQRDGGSTRGFTVTAGETNGHGAIARPRTRKTLAVGRVLGGLYIIDKHSFTPATVEQIPDDPCLPLPNPDSQSDPRPITIPPNPAFLAPLEPPEPPASSPPQSSAGPILRRTHRQPVQPHWLQDFICNQSSSSPSYDPLIFSPAHMLFLTQVDAGHC